MMKLFPVLLTTILATTVLASGDAYWQQRVEYRMEIDFDVTTHRFQGKQYLTYFNNSPDTLTQVFYHLYYNAFQPNSMADMRSRTMMDPDPRVGDRIKNLRPTEIGYHKIMQLKQDGEPVDYEVNETILEVRLPNSIPPGEKVVFEMDFETHVPLLIRRGGRESREGIDYSMSQWYPKICEYDSDGWHPNPYVHSEFYGVWGDFEVDITIDKAYTLGATGYLQNASEIGRGYEDPDTKVADTSGDRLTWRWKAENVHDFVWAADRDYTHTRHQAADGTMLHFLYQETARNSKAWEKLPKVMDAALQYANKHFGQYPYGTFSFIQAGDSGMEYPMATLITGNRPFRSLVGVSVHELLHNWFYGVLGTNESLYAWMDEGFVSYAEQRTINELARLGLIEDPYQDNPFKASIRRFAHFSKMGVEEPMTIHADHFLTYTTYAIASYTKGQIFLNQLEYIIGKEAFAKTMLRYFDEWKFKHPDAHDFLRIAEKCSGMVLDWYMEYWVNTTHSIDYSIEGVKEDGKHTVITLKRQEEMPMPMEVAVRQKNGKETIYYMPLVVMRGAKPAPVGKEVVLLEDWPWTHPTYEFSVPVKLKQIVEIELDPDYSTADIDRDNNVYSVNEEKS